MCRQQCGVCIEWWFPFASVQNREKEEKNHIAFERIKIAPFRYPIISFKNVLAKNKQLQVIRLNSIHKERKWSQKREKNRKHDNKQSTNIVCNFNENCYNLETETRRERERKKKNAPKINCKYSATVAAAAAACCQETKYKKNHPIWLSICLDIMITQTKQLCSHMIFRVKRNCERNRMMCALHTSSFTDKRLA